MGLRVDASGLTQLRRDRRGDLVRIEQPARNVGTCTRGLITARTCSLMLAISSGEKLPTGSLITKNQSTGFPKPSRAATPSTGERGERVCGVGGYDSDPPARARTAPNARELTGACCCSRMGEPQPGASQESGQHGSEGNAVHGDHDEPPRSGQGCEVARPPAAQPLQLPRSSGRKARRRRPLAALGPANKNGGRSC